MSKKIIGHVHICRRIAFAIRTGDYSEVSEKEFQLIQNFVSNNGLDSFEWFNLIPITSKAQTISKCAVTGVYESMWIYRIWIPTQTAVTA